MILKACPTALHPDGTPLRMPAFEHPVAGPQLIKGTMEVGEGPDKAAARELYEESGLETRSALFLGDSLDICDDQHWHFSLCRLAGPVRDHWQHYCADDGGHLFKFFWLEIATPLPDGFDPVFQRAMDWIATKFS